MISSEHPDIESIQRTGWPCGHTGENPDTREERVGFANEFFADFLSFAEDGDPDILNHFIQHYERKYKNWLN